MEKLSEKQKMQKKYVNTFIISQWGEPFSKWRPRQNHEQLGLLSVSWGRHLPKAQGPPCFVGALRVLGGRRSIIPAF